MTSVVPCKKRVRADEEPLCGQCKNSLSRKPSIGFCSDCANEYNNVLRQYKESSKMILAENGFVWACNAHELVPRYQHDCCEGHHIERICLDCDHELREELRLAHCHLGWGIAEQFKWHEGPKSPAPRVKWQNCKPAMHDRTYSVLETAESGASPFL